MIDFAAIFNSIPEALAVLLIAMLPIAELRAAIPIGIETFQIAWPTVAILAIIGNIIPVILLLWLLEPLSSWLSKHSQTAKRFFNWLFERTRRQQSKRFARWGAVALISFVAIPLPITGGWTGSVAAFVFGVPKPLSLIYISIGIIIAAIIVTSLTVGLTSLF